MGRIIALDYGEKRVGIAVTDPLKIIASPLDTIDTPNIFAFLQTYLEKESVEKIIVGLPMRLDTTDTHASAAVREFVARARERFPNVPLETIDERFTSFIAKKAIASSGMGKMKRREKKLIDKVSASLILQTYLGM